MDLLRSFSVMLPWLHWRQCDRAMIFIHVSRGMQERSLGFRASDMKVLIAGWLTPSLLAVSGASGRIADLMRKCNSAD